MINQRIGYNQFEPGSQRISKLLSNFSWKSLVQSVEPADTNAFPGLKNVLNDTPILQGALDKGLMCVGRTVILMLIETEDVNPLGNKPRSSQREEHLLYRLVARKVYTISFIQSLRQALENELQRLAVFGLSVFQKSLLFVQRFNWKGTKLNFVCNSAWLASNKQIALLKTQPERAIALCFTWCMRPNQDEGVGATTQGCPLRYVIGGNDIGA